MADKHPLSAFRFIIEMEYNGLVVGGFSQFSGVKMRVDTLQARSGNDPRGVQEVVPVMTRFEPVILTKGVIGDNAFLNWLFGASMNPYQGPNMLDRRNLNVVAVNDSDNDGWYRGVVWSLKGAYPIGYELSPMDGGRSEVLTESLTFAIHGVERIVENGVDIWKYQEKPPKRAKIREAHPVDEIKRL